MTRRYNTIFIKGYDYCKQIDVITSNIRWCILKDTECFTDTASISSSSNQSRVSTTPGPSSVSSSGYPASPALITLDSPSPPRSPRVMPKVQTSLPVPPLFNVGVTNGNSASAPMYTSNSIPYMDLDSEMNRNLNYYW